MIGGRSDGGDSRSGRRRDVVPGFEPRSRGKGVVALTRMTLAQAYVFKASKRLTILDVLNREEFYSDVVREAQEPVELALKGILREIGIDPPKQHDVGDSGTLI
jgi:hypothetical protein